MKREEEVARRCELFERQGWFPVRWAHHPEPVKQVFRLAGFRPMGKMCFRNAQKFVIAHDRLAHSGRIAPIDGLTYVEGIAFGVIPFVHGWIRIGDVDVDLTLDGPTKQTTEHAYAVSMHEVYRSCARGFYQPVDENRLQRLLLEFCGLRFK